MSNPINPFFSVSPDLTTPQLEQFITTTDYGDMGDRFDDLFGDARKMEGIEAASFARVLSSSDVHTILDCSCGTGIQALGLAELGFRVFASDLSERMTHILMNKCRNRQISILVKVSDFRDLQEWGNDQFDCVLSGGNSLSVLPDYAEMVRAIRSMANHTRRNGIVLVGGRDYTVPKRREESVYARGIRLITDGTGASASPEWIVDFRLYGRDRVQVMHTFVRPQEDGLAVERYAMSMMYVTVSDVIAAMEESGLQEIEAYDATGSKKYVDGEWYIVRGLKESQN